MAAAFVQNLGTAINDTAGQTTTVLSISKTVTLNNLIAVGWESNNAAPVTVSSVTDNLGNTYVRSERVTLNSETADLWYAPITTGGTLTTVTANHASTQHVYLIAAEFSGVGTLSSVGGGTGVSANVTATWITSKTIPGNGIAIGVVSVNNAPSMSAGSASGAPSTTIIQDAIDQTSSVVHSIGLYHALPGSGNVTTFTGTATLGTAQNNAGAGGLFNPSGASTSLPAVTTWKNHYFAGTFVPENLQIEYDSSAIINSYIVRGAAANYGPFYNRASILKYGLVQAYYDAPNADTANKGLSAGTMVLAQTSFPAARGSFEVHEPIDGWLPGQWLFVVSPMLNAGVGQAFKITKITRSYYDGKGHRKYLIEFGGNLMNAAAVLQGPAGRPTGTN